jgi:hypothetical protein
MFPRAQQVKRPPSISTPNKSALGLKADIPNRLADVR